MSGRPKSILGRKQTVNFTLDTDIIARIEELANKDAGKYSAPNKSAVVGSLLRDALGLNTPEIDGE